MTLLKPRLETLRTLLDKHPDWADLPVGVLRGNGEVDYVGWAGSAFASYPASENETLTGSPVVLLFSGN